MQPASFKLERYFANYEFNVAYLLSASDPESLTLRELLALADPATRILWENLSLCYTESAGHPVLRQEIAATYQTLAPDDVLTVVPEEGIFLALQAILRPGDHVIATFPAYQSLIEIVRALGCSVSLWSLAVQDGAWQLDLDFVADHITGRTRLLILNFPHNPTGYVPPAALHAATVDLARSRNLYLFSDEMYRGLEYAADRRLPAACDLYERAMSLGGLSKGYGLPGLRTGWLASRNGAWLAECARRKDYTTICAGAPGEILAIAALRAAKTILGRNLGIIRRNLDLADAFFARHRDVLTWLPPAAGTIAFPQLNARWPADQYCDALREGQGVLLAPASMFDYPGNHVRVGFGRLSFAQGLERWEAFIERA